MLTELLGTSGLHQRSLHFSNNHIITMPYFWSLAGRIQAVIHAAGSTKAAKHEIGESSSDCETVSNDRSCNAWNRIPAAVTEHERQAGDYKLGGVQSWDQSLTKSAYSYYYYYY